MAELLNIFDGGIKKVNGKSLGVVVFELSIREGAPEIMVGYCQPNFRESIIKNLKRLFWNKPKTTRAEDAAASKSPPPPPPPPPMRQIREGIE